MKEPKKATLVYANLYRFGVHFEDAYVVATFAIKVCVFTCTVVCVYNVLMFNLPPLPYLLMPLTVAACVVVFVYILIPLCSLNTISGECIKSGKAEAMTKLDCKVWMSIRPIRMAIGPFYTLDKSTILLYFDFVLMNVINIILFFPAE